AAGADPHRDRDRLLAHHRLRRPRAPHLPLRRDDRPAAHRRGGAPRVPLGGEGRRWLMGFVETHAALWPVLVPVLGVAITTCLWKRRVAQRVAAYGAAALLFASTLLLLA